MYFSGFCLKNEEKLLGSFFTPSEYTIVGFSYGAVRALEYSLASTTRIDKIILLSPAFFQSSSASFIRTQIRYFNTNQEQYTEQFYTNVSYPADSSIIENFKSKGTAQELSELLTYEWDIEKFKILLDRGVEIDVFVGGIDKIIDTEKCLEFFSKICNVYLIKNAGHLLYTK
jgi:pimeloyl-ACP methyl ester carboxylesterase